jgi:hypothetical protein
MNTNIHSFFRPSVATFNVIEEFAALSPKRKMSLCDRLFVEGRDAFQNTVKLFWPQATAQDFKKLENFLLLLKNTAH